MTIWRVENEQGKGCYWGQNTPIKIWLCNRHDRHSLIYPLPQEDKGIERKPVKNEICGFLNLKQAINWFTQYELKKIKKERFFLKQIEVKEITAYGEKQILCIR